MFKFARLSLMLVMSALLLAGFGCASNNEDTAPVTSSSAASDQDAAIRDAMSRIEKKHVVYGFDRYDLDSSAKEDLKEKAELLKKYPNIGTTIEGHCDERGTREYNYALGERRAKASYDYLVMNGVNPDQLSTISYGKDRPVAFGTGDEVWEQNRRTQFKTKLLDK